MGFPFLSSLKPYVKSELISKLDPINFTLLRPWISVTSNLGPKGYTLKSDSYTDIFGVNGKYESNQSSLNGFKPKPVITGFNIDFAARGVTKTGTISFTCFTLDQFETIQQYFLEPGISVFVQWGWNKSSSTNQNIFPQPIDAGTQLKYYRTNETLIKNRDATRGCYDNFMGIVTGGKSSINNNEYKVECKITAIGEILMGSSIADPAINCEKVDKPKVKAFTAEQLKNGRKDARHTFHWMAFFNSLPDGLKNIKDMKSLGLDPNSGIDSRIDFINYDEESMEDAKDEADGSIIFTDSFTVAGKKINGVDSDVGSPIHDGKYLRFSALVKIINHIQKIKQPVETSEKDKSPGTIGIDLSNSYCGAIEGMYSVDPSCFIPNIKASNFMEENSFFQLFEDGGYTPQIPMDNSVKGKGNIILSFPTEKDETVPWNGKNYLLKAGTVGKTENLYINHDLAIECINTALNTSIKDCLDDMLKTIEKSTLGLWDFQVIKPEDQNNGKITIIDCNMTAFETANDKPAPESFNLFGNQCVFLEFEFDSDIPKGLMNQIVMDKSVAESESTNSSTKGRGLFSNQKDIVIVDSVKAKPVDPCAPPANPANQNSTTSKEDKKANFDGFVKTSKILLQPIYSEDTNPNSLDGKLIPGISTNSQAELAKQQSADGGNGSIGSPINSKIKFKILGNSGFRVGDLLTVKGLPKSYQYNPTKGRNGAFMVLNLSHTVEDKGWYTNVECMFRPY